ncbi:MAG TPA: hypothetical protein VK745_23870 [Polyangiaceae bacterium]|jgi:hypothetical protein|nr:hypothetical protein [Polyangiaceae bacterium]
MNRLRFALGRLDGFGRWRGRCSAACAALLVALASIGCGKSATVTASRYVEASVGSRVPGPVCFTLVAASLGLAERTLYTEWGEACARAAAAEGVPVASGQGCWPADLQWASEPAGRSLADCEQEVAGYGCSASAVFRKTLRLRLTDPSTGQVGIDALATLDSTTKSIVANTAFALCSAAFRHQPRAERSVTVKVSLPQ